MELQYKVDSSIRGYHVYEERWTSHIGETLQCNRDLTRLAAARIYPRAWEEKVIT